MLEGFIVLIICLAVLIAIIQFVMPRFGITEEQARSGGCACCGSSASCSSSSGGCEQGQCPTQPKADQKP